MDYDVITVGAGHNALIASAYLAQAGYRVGVFERRPRVGGAVVTEERVPGYQFDLGGSAHILIRLTPVVEELGLERYGLSYLELDPLFVSPGLDRDKPVFFYRSVEQTVDHLESLYPGEGRAYRQMYDDWVDFGRAVRDAFLNVPGPLQLGKTMLRRRTKLDWKRALGAIMKPYGEVAGQYFKEERVRTPLVWMAAQSGPPPTEPLSGPFLLWHPLYHEGGVARPRGGSGMLTQALRRHIESHGGDVHTSAPVESIMLEGTRAIGIRVNNNNYTARAVLSGTHINETLNRLLPADARPPEAERLRIGNGFGAIVRLALNRPVRYATAPGVEARTGLQLLCESTQQIHAAYGDYLNGDPSRVPPIVAMTFSAVDDTLAPPGGEVLWLWGQYYPYELSGGRSWDAIGDEVAMQLIDRFERYAPGTKDSIVDYLFQHPLWLERELGLFRGNVMHLEMSIDQMFMFRPALAFSGYRSHLNGLYLTGASTHPGGGIMGASGRNAARVLLKDLERRKV